MSRERARFGGRAGTVARSVGEGDAAIVYAQKLVAERKPLKRIRDLNARVDGDPKAFFAGVRDKVAKESRGYPADIPPQIGMACGRPLQIRFEQRTNRADRKGKHRRVDAGVTRGVIQSESIGADSDFAGSGTDGQIIICGTASGADSANNFGSRIRIGFLFMIEP